MSISSESDEIRMTRKAKVQMKDCLGQNVWKSPKNMELKSTLMAQFFILAESQRNTISATIYWLTVEQSS